MNTSQTPIQKNVILLGAGNAHLRFVRMFGMNPVPGVAVTLVSESSVIPYSAMVPGCIAGDYRRDEVTIDLVRLCRAFNVRFLADRALSLDPVSRQVSFAARPALSYDAVSLGLGSVPAVPPKWHDSELSWLMRPLNVLLDRLDTLEQRLRANPGSFHLAVVGGGASGCELALAIAKRFAGVSGFRMTLIQRDPQLMPRLPARAGRLFADLLRNRAITLRLDTRVTGGEVGSLLLNDSEHLPCDAVLWATNAAPPALVRTAGLPINEAGFLQVNDHLQSTGDPAVFGTGDCISLMSHPDLAKNGVYAVRQGGVLFDNVVRFLREKPLTVYHPQRLCMCMLNAADGSAVLCYGPIAWKGRLARWLKDRIDRAWVEKFVALPTMSAQGSSEEEQPSMRCGGCGNKVSGDVLSAVIKKIDAGDDPRVLMGTKAGEDASVYRMRPELFGDDPARLVEVQTVDYFKAFIDDPYLFGRIAALNAVSDLYAMNARPFSALAIATLPYARGPVQEAMLYELLSGAVESLKSLGVILAGGHTTEGSELALGFSVTGYGEEDRLFLKGGLVPGDRLILAKPLGSGALLAAWMRGQCRAAWFDRLVQAMLLPNAAASRIFRDHGVRGCTDVTGFGLAGHILEMLDASRVEVRLDRSTVPLYDGFEEVVRQGVVSSLHGDNAKVACRVVAADAPAWLFDPQTSGGLIAGVKANVAERVVEELREAGYLSASIIGEVVPLAGTELPMIHL